MANSVDPDQLPHSAASDQGLYCLHFKAYLSHYLRLLKNSLEVSQQGSFNDMLFMKK